MAAYRRRGDARRVRLRAPGIFLLLGAASLALGALNTGNNLLYLLLGALLGTLLLSDRLARRALVLVTPSRTLPRAITTGTRSRIEYTLRMDRPGAMVLGLTVEEVQSAGALTADAAFVPLLAADAPVRSNAAVAAQRRGVYPLAGVMLATSFPFGLLTRRRYVPLPGALVVWPRADLPVRPHALAGERGPRAHSGAGAAAGRHRGEYRSLREYRPGDDPADLHWRSTARRGAPIVREYERDTADEYWIVLDTVAGNGEAGEAAVEVAAALAVAAAARGDRFGLAAGAERIEPGPPAGRVEAALDVLAAASLTRTGPTPQPPATPLLCVLVTCRGGVGWGDVYLVTARRR